MKSEKMLFLISVTSMMLMTLAIKTQPLPPELAILDNILAYEEAGKDRDDIDALFKQAPFLDDNHAVANLIAYYLQATADDRNVEAVAIVLLYMTCQPEQMIIQQLDQEIVPWKKAALISLLSDFYDETVFLALIQQLDDTRLIIIPEARRPRPILDRDYDDIQQRICDVAYSELVDRLLLLGFLNDQDFATSSFPLFEEMDALIVKFTQFWIARQPDIFKELPNKRPKTLLDVVFPE